MPFEGLSDSFLGVASEDSVDVFWVCGCWRVVVDEWVVDETASEGLEGAVGESLGWGVEGVSSSLSSSQETVSAGLRAASSGERYQYCGLMSSKGGSYSYTF